MHDYTAKVCQYDKRCERKLINYSNCTAQNTIANWYAEKCSMFNNTKAEMR